MSGLSLSDLLLRTGLLTTEEVQQAVRHHQQTGVRLGQVVVDLGYAADGALYDALARVSGLERLDLTRERIERDAIRHVDSIWALDHGMVPLRTLRENGTLRVAVTDPTHLEPLAELTARTGLQVTSVLGSEAEIGRLIRHQFFEEPLVSASDTSPSPPEPSGESWLQSGMLSAHADLATFGAEQQTPAPTGEAEAIGWMQAMVEHHQENVRLLQALFELCVSRGLITRAEYLARLNEEDRRRPG